MHINPFETSADTYDKWYDDFPNTFRSEAIALKALLPPSGKWLEIGVGTGRFAVELGIADGIEPTEGMAQIARSRGINVCQGYAEALPLDAGVADAVFFITTLCFVKDVSLAMSEAARILRPDGTCIVGMLPRESVLGQMISTSPKSDMFFQHATLRSRYEVMQSMTQAGLRIETTLQTLCGSPSAFEDKVQIPQSGGERGSFVVIRARKLHD